MMTLKTKNNLRDETTLRGADDCSSDPATRRLIIFFIIACLCIIQFTTENSQLSGITRTLQVITSLDSISTQHERGTTRKSGNSSSRINGNSDGSIVTNNDNNMTITMADNIQVNPEQRKETKPVINYEPMDNFLSLFARYAGYHQQHTKGLLTCHSSRENFDNKLNNNNNISTSNVIGIAEAKIKSSTTPRAEYCCAPWSISSDDWWLHRPDWEMSLENQTHYCFSPIEDLTKASFVRELHAFQWYSLPDPTNCSVDQIEKSVEINSGHGAATAWLEKAFWHAWKVSRKPFQIIHNYRKSLYSTANRSSWAYCAEEDSRCYYLPINPCNRTFYSEGKEHYSANPPTGQRINVLKYYWMSQYLFRSNHVYRKHLYQFRVANDLEDSPQPPCVVIHVRRGDAGLPQPPFRRYAAVQEYLDAVPNLTKGETIFVLTDDTSTIDEIQKYHANDYNWKYINRPRVSNIQGGFNGHIPSGDAGYEMLVIDTELSVASRCDRFVHGESGFVKGLLGSLSLERKKVQTFYVDTKVSKAEARKFENKFSRLKSLLADVEQTIYQANQSSSFT